MYCGYCFFEHQKKPVDYHGLWGVKLENNLSYDPTNLFGYFAQ